MKMNTETYGLIAFFLMVGALIFAIIYAVGEHKKSTERSEKFRKEYAEKEKTIQQNIRFPESILTHKAGNYYHFEDQNSFKPYSVKIEDEHRVILTADNDTIVLLLENATSLADEKLIYIVPNTK